MLHVTSYCPTQDDKLVWREIHHFDKRLHKGCYSMGLNTVCIQFLLHCTQPNNTFGIRVVIREHSTYTVIFCNDNDYNNHLIASLPPSFRVNLALAYTELTEELGRLQALSSKQTEILRKASQEQASPGWLASTALEWNTEYQTWRSRVTSERMETDLVPLHEYK